MDFTNCRFDQFFLRKFQISELLETLYLKYNHINHTLDIFEVFIHMFFFTQIIFVGCIRQRFRRIQPVGDSKKISGRFVVADEGNEYRQSCELPVSYTARYRAIEICGKAADNTRSVTASFEKTER